MVIMKRSLIFIFIALCLTGCLHKSVMLDEADNVVKARICSCDGREFLVTLESVFQAVSKESRGGFTRITGANDQRISVYDTDDGRLVARIKTGIQTKRPVEFLGCSRGSLWFYSAEDGIHSRDPGTLDIRASQDSILGINPELTDNLAQCEWYQLKQYFQFNDITGNVTLTDRQGYRYILDTETLKASRVNSEYRDFDPRSDQNLATSVQFPSPSLQLSGDLRQQVVADGKEVNPGLTFLEPKFIIDRNPGRILKSVERKLTAERPETMDRRKERFTRDLEECRGDILSTGYSHRYTLLLSTDSQSFFVLHRASTEKDAGVVISRVHITDSLKLTEQWHTEIADLFYDPSAARETNSFKKVFSKGDPEFGFSFFDLPGDRLVFLWMLHAVCLDVNSGKVLWKFRI